MNTQSDNPQDTLEERIIKMHKSMSGNKGGFFVPWLTGIGFLFNDIRSELRTQTQRITEAEAMLTVKPTAMEYADQAQRITALEAENEKLKKEQKADRDYLDSLYENAGVGHD